MKLLDINLTKTFATHSPFYGRILQRTISYKKINSEKNWGLQYAQIPRHVLYFFLDFRQRRNQQPAEEMLLLPIHGPKFNQENMRFFVNYKKEIFRWLSYLSRKYMCRGKSRTHPAFLHTSPSKKYCAKGSASPGVDLRFCPLVLLFKYCTGVSNESSSLGLNYVFIWWCLMNKR